MNEPIGIIIEDNFESKKVFAFCEPPPIFDISDEEKKLFELRDREGAAEAYEYYKRTGQFDNQ